MTDARIDGLYVTTLYKAPSVAEFHALQTAVLYKQKLGAYATAALALGAKGFWTLDDASGTVGEDASGNGRPITYGTSAQLGQTSLSADVGSKSVRTTGAANGFFTFPPNIAATSWTLAFGFKGEAGSTVIWRDQTTTTAGYFLDVTGTNPVLRISGTDRTLTGVASTVFKNGTVHHVVITYDGSTCAIYLDGALLDSFAMTRTVNLVSPSNFGKNGSGSTYSAGTYDVISWHESILTSTNVADLYATFQGLNTATMTASSTLTATATFVSVFVGAANLTASSSLTVAATATSVGAADLTASSSLTVAATVTPASSGIAFLTASSSLAATATLQTIALGVANLTASSSLAAAATVQTVVLGVANLPASSSLTGAATLLPGPGALTGKVLWLRAVELPLGPVTSWPDKSGTNVVVTGTNGAAEDGYYFSNTATGQTGPYSRVFHAGTSGTYPTFTAKSWTMPATSNGELWMVVQGYAGAWTYGTSGFQNGYVPGQGSNGTTYDDTGSTTQHAVTPALQLGTWRVYRVVVSGNTWTASHDNVQAGRYSGSTRSWASAPKVLDRFDGLVAEILVVNRTLTAAEATSLYRYYNSVYNLAVQTGATIPAVATLTAKSTLKASAFVGVTTVSAAATLVAKTTLRATIAPVRLGTATLTATSMLKATAQATVLQAIAELTASSVFEGTPVPPAQWDGEVTLYAAAALFAEADSGAIAEAFLEATSILEAAGTAFTPYIQPNDPRTGRPQYRLIVAHRDGERLAELTNATVSAIESGVGVGSSFNFEAPTLDPKMAYAKAPGRQAQVWRGTDLEFRGPIVTLDDDQEGGVTTVKCRDPFWYLESGRRVIGRIPKRDLLVNGSFQTGEEPPWQGAYAPDSVPKAQPVRDVIDTDFFGTQMKALQISGVDKVVTVTKELKTAAVFEPNSSTYLPGGEASVKAVANLMPKTGSLTVNVKGYTADNRINGDYGDGMELSKARADVAAATIRSVRPNAKTTTAGYGYYYQVPGGLDANRRVVVSWSGVQEASGHRQYEVQTLRITQPVAKKAPLPLTFVGWTKITKWLGPSKDGWGVYIQVANPAKPKDKPIDSAYAAIDEKTPRDRWLRMEATVEVPADGIEYEVQVRFYPPAGTALWTRGGLYPGDQLGYFDVDQALIIKALVEHAQDPSMGKGNLGIGTRCQPTGIVRTREYPYDERMPIDTAITEIATLFRGPEVVMEVTATAQTVVTYHPRQGQRTSQVLVQGGNVVAYEAPTDNREAASSIILQSDGFGADREEGYASDLTALDGLMLERVISTEGDTPVTELEEGAVKALKRLKSPQPALWVTIDPARTGEVRDALGQGDYLRAVIPDAGIDGTYRYVKRRLHPGADLLELMLTPEED